MKKVIIKKDSIPQKIMQQILALPPLQEQGFKQVDPRRAAVCLQAEYGILDYSISQGEHPVEYIGTKELYDCIFVVIKNESNEYFFIHIDQEIPGNYFAAINQFKKASSQLEVTLIGGKPAPALGDPLYYKIASDAILLVIIAELIQLANKHTITIVGQRLLQHNYQKLPKSKSSSTQDQIKDLLVVKNKKEIYQRFCKVVQILYLYLHGHYFNSAFINIRFPSPDSLDREIRLDETKSKQLSAFVKIISDVCGKMPTRTLEQIDKECVEIKRDKTQKKAQVNFYQRVSDTMSSAGAQYLNVAGFGKPEPALTDFVIELKTGQIFSIPRHIKIYNEELRAARSRYFDHASQKSFLFFSSQSYQPIPPPNTKFELEYSQVAKLIKDSKYTSSTREKDDSVSTMFLQLHQFRKKWKNEVPSLRAYHVSILCDSLEAIFAVNRLGINRSITSIISEYTTPQSVGPS